MSRSGYSDDCEHVWLWRRTVDNAMFGRRGQLFLRRLRDALDAMPVRRLISGELVSADGEVCALGAVDPNIPVDDPEDRKAVARHFNIAPALAAEIAYVNDEEFWRETPEQRWRLMREWVEALIR